MTLIQKRFAELSEDTRKAAEELLAMFPVGEREDHLEAFEMQIKKPLSKETVSALETYVRSNGGKKQAAQPAPAAEAKFRSSFGGAAAGKISLEKPMKSLNEDTLPRVYGLMADKRNFQVEVINSVESAYRTMDLSIAKRSEAAGLRLEALSGKILPALIDEEVQAGRVGAGGSVALQAVVGRVCSETEGEAGLNGHNLILEGDLTHSAGRRAKFYVSDCAGEFCLFPGQVIGVVGKSLRGGEEFVAQRIVPGLEISSLKPATIEGRALYAGAPVHVTVAAGPFSPKDSLNFQVLEEISRFVVDYKPHLLVLTGPFLDSGNSVVSAGACFDGSGTPVTFEEIYAREIFPRLEILSRACRDSETRLVIVPAVTEIGCEHPLPQPPLDWDKKFPGLTSASNPCMIRINRDFNMVVTSQDAVMPLTTDLFVSPALAARGVPRVDLCLEQLIRQADLFPTGSAPVDSGRPLSLGADAYILPSQIQQFAKSVCGRVFVNPGQVCKGSGGSLANLYISPEGVRAEVAKLG